ncbi:MAG: hypothetical protein CL569_07965 [Alphaproteobacteria bacterium]|nr:hypothetical protein [Alphaproteobacteria bacterium]
MDTFGDGHRKDRSAILSDREGLDLIAGEHEVPYQVGRNAAARAQRQVEGTAIHPATWKPSGRR